MPLRALRDELGHVSHAPDHACHCRAGVCTTVRGGCAVCRLAYEQTCESVALTLIEHEEQLVMIRRTKAPLAGYWAPPAGHVEFGESVTHAAVREAREESGLEITLDELAAVYTQDEQPDGRARMVISAYRSHSLGGSPVAGDDAGDIRLFSADQIPYQPPPAGGTATDYWVYAVIQELIAPWRRPPHRFLTLLQAKGDLDS